MRIPPDEIMKQMAAMAMEQATTFFAAQADEFARSIPADTSGPDALKAFAAAIRSTNTKRYPKGVEQ